MHCSGLNPSTHTTPNSLSSGFKKPHFISEAWRGKHWSECTLPLTVPAKSLDPSIKWKITGSWSPSRFSFASPVTGSVECINMNISAQVDGALQFSRSPLVLFMFTLSSLKVNWEIQCRRTEKWQNNGNSAEMEENWRGHKKAWHVGGWN